MSNYGTKFGLGQIVYLRTEEEQKEYMVIGIKIRPTGVVYELASGYINYEAFEMEISSVKDVTKSLGLESKEA